MNTNRADAYSPEAIANREAEGMTICDNCLTEHYSYEAHTCPSEIEYYVNYAAAPDFDFGTWDYATDDLLDEVDATLGDHFEANIDTEWGRQSWELDKAGLAWAREKKAQGFAVYIGQDEDGYYFLKASDSGERSAHGEATR